MHEPIQPESIKIPKWLLWLGVSLLISTFAIVIGKEWGLVGCFLLIPLIFNKKR